MPLMDKPSGQTWARVAYDIRERAERVEKERDEALDKVKELLARLDGKMAENKNLQAEVERLRAEHAADLSRLDGWRLRAGVAEKWQRAVAEGTGYINQPEGQDGYEVADAETIVAAWKRARRAEDGFTDVALRQREACAEWAAGLLDPVAGDCVRATPLVTEEKP